MAINTYVELDSITVASTTQVVTFSSISQNYTDLVLVATPKYGWSDSFPYMQFNGDAAANYSGTNMFGTGSSTTTFRTANTSNAWIGWWTAGGTAFDSSFTVQIQDYTHTNKWKTYLARHGRGNGSGVSYPGAEDFVGTWRSQAAITSISISASNGGTLRNIEPGSKFALYGIKAWSNTEASPKAIGGYVYSDSSYWYHAFPFSSTFTPTQSITADILVVAGGGGSGTYRSGGGGAGGLLTFTSQSLTATNYNVTVGAGGAGGTSSTGANGANSQFASLTASVGGGGGGSGNGPGTGANGGSGGGGTGFYGDKAGGSFTSGQGYAGGTGSDTNPYPSGGGGGAGAAGGTYSGNNAGNGGIGATSSLINAIGAATKTGEFWNGNYYYAGGGGGGLYLTTGLPGAGGKGGGANGAPANGAAIAGAVSTGGGGGGSGSAAASGNDTGGSGGSGIVVVRYAK